MKKTIIYYTSNKEHPDFEGKVQRGIIRANPGLPIISVSQKPIQFGYNICVGDVGHSYLNAFRQLLIGCEAAVTDFVVMAEADCFYPQKGYFDFDPTNLNTIYSYDNVWILWKKKGKDLYYYKEQTHASLIYGREFLIRLLRESLKGLPEWSRERVGFPFYKPGQQFVYFIGDPIVNIKTGDSMNYGTRTSKDVQPVVTLPIWGPGKDLKEKIWMR
jgi:hypothetical protein